MDVERILITVRTYPNISSHYAETVCTAGINTDGHWRRLYPIPLRYLDKDRQFGTFDIIEVGLGQASMDVLKRAGPNCFPSV